MTIRPVKRQCSLNSNQHSIVTGGTSGLGLGLALRLLRWGGRVSVLARGLDSPAREKLDEAADRGGGEWRFWEVDIVDAQGVLTAVKEAVSAFGTPQLVINSAGIAINRTFAQTSADAFQQVIDVNLLGSRHVAAAVLPHMQSGSRLVFLASVAGLVSNYGYAAYGASKFAVLGLATTLRYEYQPRGVGVTCVCPPEVKTPMVAIERAPGNASPISLALKDIAGSLDTDYACDAILKGIDRGQWLVVPGVMAKLTAQFARLFPALFYRFMEFNIRRLMKEYPADR